MTDEQDSVLCNLLIDRQSLEKFEQSWLDEVSDPADEVCIGVRQWKLPKLGKCTVYLLRGGLACVEDSRGRWSAYESESRVAEREYYAAWARFCRGTWTSKTPQIEGTFPTRTLEGDRGRDRTLKRIDGRLRDVTVGAGFTGYGMVSEWRGDWFEFPYPPLRGAV